MKLTQENISEVKLVYRTRVKASDRPHVKCSKDAYDLLMGSWDQDSIEHFEEFKIMLMSRSNRVLGIATVSKGGISGTVTDVRIILQMALKANACGIIVCHNHPSCNTDPSESDIQITNKIRDSAKIMDLVLLDHLILTAENKYYSFADNGLL